MFKLAEATDIRQWDSDASKISITGLGDELPSDLKNCDIINQITCNIREISAAPINSVHDPKVTNTFLNKAAIISGIKLVGLNLNPFCKHKLDNDGWGKPVSLELLNEWHNAI